MPQHRDGYIAFSVQRESNVNLDKLKQAEAAFLKEYPEGFGDPALETVRKRHNVDKLVDYAASELTEVTFNQPEKFTTALVTIISRASMVSRFEKPQFKDFIGALNSDEKSYLANAYKKRLKGRLKKQGFDEIVDMLARHKLARWSVVSAVPFYFAPNEEVFVKPTTAKGLIENLEVTDLKYQPRPTWEFYQGYQRLIKTVRQNVDKSLAPNNAALTGFLMMSL